MHVAEGKRGAATAAGVREGTAVELTERQPLVSLLLALAGSVCAEVRRAGLFAEYANARFNPRAAKNEVKPQQKQRESE